MGRSRAGPLGSPERDIRTARLPTSFGKMELPRPPWPPRAALVCQLSRGLNGPQDGPQCADTTAVAAQESTAGQGFLIGDASLGWNPSIDHANPIIPPLQCAR